MTGVRVDTGTVDSFEPSQPAKLPALPTAPDTRPVPEALKQGYEPRRYDENDYRIGLMVPVADKLDQASRDTLAALMGGWPIVPANE